ncbi:MAG: YbaB/EbfC family nucleoid-associated protein [Syntrophomonadaceae bacterium]|nr:YbaB/EbfC family nucleoid-associated protein [Syntrophomonadaceae bacterium]
MQNNQDLMKMLGGMDKLRESLAEVEKSLKNGSMTVASQNNLVSVSINHQQEVLDLFIDNSLLSPARAGLLKASVVEAINEAVRSSRNKMIEETARVVSQFNTGG